MRQESLQEKQAPLDAAIWKAVFAHDFPEDVSRIRLTLERTNRGSYRHTLEATEESQPDLWVAVTPSEELFEATRGLAVMLGSAGAEFQSAIYDSWALEDGRWKTAQSYEYSDSPE